MLTAKENMREAIRGGNPDRFVNQFEGISLLMHPYMMTQPLLKRGMENVVNGWGVTNSFPENVPGAFPVHTPDKIVVKDIEQWQDYVHAPSLKFSDELWNICKDMYAAVDGTKAYKAAFVAPGLFEQCHHLCSMQEALMNYMEYPDEMHDLIKYLTDWELELAEGICSNLHPDAIFHHDDWGSELNSFLRPSIFEDFFLEPYQKIYGYYHSHGVELIFHHSDSYCANILPIMIDMGIDVWQGCMHSNNVPECIEKYGDPGQKCVGICGSGIIDIISELFRCGMINAKGLFVKEGSRIRRDHHGMGRYVLAEASESETEREISINEVDIDNFIRAKGAIFSAIDTLLKSVDMTVDGIDDVYVAGGIGSGINMGNAVNIGMFPDVPLEKFHYIGNSSLTGAYAMVMSDEANAKTAEVASNMTYLELSTHPGYMDAFVAACFIPHTDSRLFPHSVQEA